MAVKIIDNISIVQAIPNVNAEIVRDVSKPLSFYLVGTGSGQWSATVTLYEIDPIGYKKIGNDTSFTVTNSNPMELFTWSSTAKSFVIRVSSIQNASVTVYMTQAESSQLERILLTEPSSGTKAMPSDIVGCAAEYVPGQGWIGNLGVLDSKAILDSFPTNALVPGKVWAIVASASSFAKYNFMSSGWVLENSIDASGNFNVLGYSANPFPDNTARNAAYSTAPALRTPAYVGAPGTVPTRYEYVGPGVDDAAWVAMPGAQVGGGVAASAPMFVRDGKQLLLSTGLIFSMGYSSGQIANSTAETDVLPVATGDDAVDRKCSFANALYGLCPIIRGGFLQNTPGKLVEFNAEMGITFQKASTKWVFRLYGGPTGAILIGTWGFRASLSNSYKFGSTVPFIASMKAVIRATNSNTLNFHGTGDMGVGGSGTIPNKMEQSPYATIDSSVDNYLRLTAQCVELSGVASPESICYTNSIKMKAN